MVPLSFFFFFEWSTLVFHDYVGHKTLTVETSVAIPETNQNIWASSLKSSLCLMKQSASKNSYQTHFLYIWYIKKYPLQKKILTTHIFSIFDIKVPIVSKISSPWIPHYVKWHISYKTSNKWIYRYIMYRYMYSWK